MICFDINIGKKSVCMLFVALYIFINGCSPSNFHQLSRDIRKQSSEKGFLMKQIRTMLYKKGALDFINYKLDTVYMISLWEYESGFVYGKIWNNTGNVNYSYGQGHLDIRKDNYPFKEELLYKIRTWNFDPNSLKVPKTIVLPSYVIMAKRIVISQNKIRVDTTSLVY